MSLRRHLLITLVFATLASACSLVLDPAEHRGSDRDAALCVDADGDGHRATACGGDDCDDSNANIFPGAPPRCGDAIFEGCPGDAPLQPADLFGTVARQGLLPPVTIYEGSSPAIVSLAALPFGGREYGQAIAVIGVQKEDGYNPIRVDIPLDAPSSWAAGTLGADVDASTRVDSIVTSKASASALGVAFSRSAVGYWYGAISLSDETVEIDAHPLVIIYDGLAFRVRGDEPAQTIEYGYRSAEIPTTFTWTTISGPPFAPIAITKDVPAGALRTITAESGAIMFQDGSGDFWFDGFRANPMDLATFVHFESNSQEGKASFVDIGEKVHLLAYYEPSSGKFRIDAFECDLSAEKVCARRPEVGGGSPMIQAGEMGGEVPAGTLLSDGRTVFAFVRRYADGDELMLRLINAEGDTTVPVPPIVLLDTRGKGGRIVDVAMDRTSTSIGSGLYVAASVDGGTSPSSVVFTGIRGCTAN